MMQLSEAVQINLIVVFGGIISTIVLATGTIIVAMLGRTASHAKAARVSSDKTATAAVKTATAAAATLYEVKNSHPTNLRDDLDEKFESQNQLLEFITETLKTVVADQGGMKGDLRNIRRDQTSDREATAEDRRQAAVDREHIRRLEQTLTPAQLARARSKTKGQ